MYGYLDEEIAGFTPTQGELIELVKNWHRKYLEIERFGFLTGQISGSDSRGKMFAGRRISLAEAVIGEKVVDKAIKEARDEFKATVDARLWHILQNGDLKQWETVQDETWRKVCEHDAVRNLNRLEQLEKESQGEFIALVLRDDPEDKRRVVLVSPTVSKLNAVIQASDEFEIVTDKSRLRALTVEQGFECWGLLRKTRHAGELQFEFPDSSPGTLGWHFLEKVSGQIKKLLRAETGRKSQGA